MPKMLQDVPCMAGIQHARPSASKGHWQKSALQAELICIADFDPSGLGGYAAALHDRQVLQALTQNQ